MTFGIGLPLVRNWTETGKRRARKEGRSFGLPDASNHAEGAELTKNLILMQYNWAMGRSTIRAWESTLQDLGRSMPSVYLTGRIEFYHSSNPGTFPSLTMKLGSATSPLFGSSQII